MIGNVPACAVCQSKVKLLEIACSAIAHSTVNKRVKHPLDFRVLADKLSRVIVLHYLFKLLDPCAEYVVVVFACLLHYLYICTVICAESNSAVEHKLHIARTGRFCSCGRNLF